MAKGKDFEQLDCQVVVVDSGTRESGLEWLQKHSYNFPLLLDQDRVFYRQLGMRRFLKKSFCMTTFQLYADQIIAGTFRGDDVTAGSDFAVMGGDFIVDSSGRLLYAHLCKTQFDRPCIETLIEFLVLAACCCTCCWDYV